MKRLLPLLMLLLATNAFAAMGKGEARLDRFFHDLKSLQADFIQTLIDPKGKVLEESKGILQIERPGRFRLEYRTPYKQLYVADGKKLWMYDQDLEQITVRTQGSALGSTPALLLSGSEPIEKNFRLKELGFHEGFQWLELRPKAKDASFDYIRLALEGDVVRAMEMVDGFGQKTRLYLEKVERNPSLPAGAFTFTPPKGVDVIGETKQ